MKRQALGHRLDGFGGRHRRRVQEAQIGGRDHIAWHHDHQPLDDVAQLAHVTRPAVLLNRAHGTRLEAFDAPAVLARELRHEVICEPRDVFLPLAQRRNEDRNDVETKVQIVSEPSGPDLRLEIFVGRRQHARVDLDPRRPSDRLHGLLLKDPEHLGLRLQAHVADLVEKDRAAVSALELASPIGDRA